MAQRLGDPRAERNSPFTRVRLIIRTSATLNGRGKFRHRLASPFPAPQCINLPTNVAQFVIRGSFQYIKFIYYSPVWSTAFHAFPPRRIVSVIVSRDEFPALHRLHRSWLSVVHVSFRNGFVRAIHRIETNRIRTNPRDDSPRSPGRTNLSGISRESSLNLVRRAIRTLYRVLRITNLRTLRAATVACYFKYALTGCCILIAWNCGTETRREIDGSDDCEYSVSSVCRLSIVQGLTSFVRFRVHVGSTRIDTRFSDPRHRILCIHGFFPSLSRSFIHLLDIFMKEFSHLSA